MARTVGRQNVEQENFTRRITKLRASHQSSQRGGTNASEQNTPEHDLNPPKFARKAFELVLGNWSAVKTLFEVGMRLNKTEDAVVVEDIFHLSEQNGATHLDKFVFTLLARCPEQVLLLSNIFSKVK